MFPNRNFPVPKLLCASELGARRRNIAGVAVLVALLVLALPAAAIGRAGALDRSFGDGGRVATAVFPFQSGIFFIPPPPAADRVEFDAGVDGAVVAARGNTVLRYRPDGSLDPGFGNGGHLVITAVEGLSFQLAAVAIDAEQRVWVFGSVIDPTVKREIPGYMPARVYPTLAAVMRFDPTGELDPEFGGGDGVFLGNLGLRSKFTATQGVPLVAVDSAAIDSAGRAVLSIAELGVHPTRSRSLFGWLTGSLARLTPAGELDQTFGRGGVARNIVPRTQIYSDFCLSGDGSPVIAGRKWGSSPPLGWVARLRVDGSPDPEFAAGGSGYVLGGSGAVGCELAGGFAMLQPRNSVHSGERPTWGVVRISADGKLRRFGHLGRATVRLPRGAQLTDIAAGGNGHVLLAGTLRKPKRGKARPRSFFTVIRLLASGKPDRRFGRRGWVRTGFGRRTGVSAPEAVIDGGARLVVAGSGSSPWLQPSGLLLARYKLRNR